VLNGGIISPVTKRNVKFPNFQPFLVFCDDKGKKLPRNDTEPSLKTTEFFNSHPVFSLNEATEILAPRGGRSGTLERLKYHLKVGRLKLVTRGVYAVVPPGVSVEGFQPDPFLVAAAVRPDGIFSHHSALELLGAAHSVWSRYTLYVERRRRPLRVNNTDIRFLEHPGPMRSESCRKLGIRRVEYRGKLLQTTGPERTLVEGFRRPERMGGLPELVDSAGGFAVLDLDLLQEILQCYGTANLWAATGWFLERFRESFHVTGAILDRLARHCPRAPQYLERNRRGGVLAARWNMVVPKTLINLREPDEPES
jgi:predicted transcriptional regulator of viral defense system